MDVANRLRRRFPPVADVRNSRAGALAMSAAAFVLSIDAELARGPIGFR